MKLHLLCKCDVVDIYLVKISIGGDDNEMLINLTVIILFLAEGGVNMIQTCKYFYLSP
jgi:hypothetical protein